MLAIALSILGGRAVSLTVLQFPLLKLTRERVVDQTGGGGRSQNSEKLHNVRIEWQKWHGIQILIAGADGIVRTERGSS